MKNKIYLLKTGKTVLLFKAIRALAFMVCAFNICVGSQVICSAADTMPNAHEAIESEVSIENALYFFALGEYEKSSDLLLRVKGDAVAQLQLGVMAYHGIGRSVDVEEAVKWFKLSSSSKNSEAQFWLGTIYLDEKKYESHRADGLSLLKESAYNGGLLAQKRLGEMYFHGSYVKTDYGKSIVYCHMAAIRGEAVTQYLLSLMYWKGLGVKKDIRKFLYWLKKAAESNNATAQYELGTLYLFGKYVIKDTKFARQLYELSAYNGNAKSKQALAEHFGDS